MHFLVFSGEGRYFIKSVTYKIIGSLKAELVSLLLNTPDQKLLKQIRGVQKVFEEEMNE